MSIFAKRAKKATQIPQAPPLSCRSMPAARTGLLPPAPHHLIPHVSGEGTEAALGGDGSVGRGLLRHRVLPSAGLGGRMPSFFPEPVHIDDNGFSGAAAMDSGYFFTNLMSDGFTNPLGYGTEQPDDTPQNPQHDATPQTDDSPQPDVTPQTDDSPQPDDIVGQDLETTSVKVSQGRSKNFSVKEDLLLVSAWLNVSMDPIKGVDQSRSTYWKRIHVYFHTNKKFASDRSQGSLMNRWSGIQHDVSVFAGCITRIECRNQSGCSVDDKIASACAMFKEEDRTHRNFPYMHCWKALKDNPKWIERRKHGSTPNHGGKKQKTSVDASPSVAALALVGGNADGGQPSGSAQERPAGKKKEKEKEKQKLRHRASLEAMEYLVDKKKEADALKDLKKEERCKKAFALQEERIKIERERVQFKRQLEEERIMNIDMTTLNYKQQQYYERLQDEILAKRLNN